MLELFPDTAALDSGELSVGGVSCSALAEQFGTPLVVYCFGSIAEYRTNDAQKLRG